MNPKLTLLTLSALSVSALNVLAQNLVVSNSAYLAATGTHYENNGTTDPALVVTGSLGSFTGTDVTLTGAAASGSGRYAAYVYDQGALTLHGGTLTGHFYGLQLTGTATAHLTGVQVSNTGGAQVIFVNLSSTLTLVGGTFRGVANDDGINIYNQSTANLTDVRIEMTGATWNYGLLASNTSTANMTGGSIYTEGVGSFGVLGMNSSTITLDGVNIETSDTSARGVQVQDSALNMTGVTITTRGDVAGGVWLWGTSTGTLANIHIETAGAGATGFQAQTASTFSATGILIHTQGAASHGIDLSGSSAATLDDITIITDGSAATAVNLAGSSTATITGGVITTNGANNRIATVPGGATLRVDHSTGISAYGGVELPGGILIADHFDLAVSGSSAHAINIYNTGTALVASSTIAGLGSYEGPGQGAVVGLFSNAEFSGSNVHILAAGAERARGVIAMGATLNLDDSTVTSSHAGIHASASGTVNLRNTAVKAAASGIDLDYDNGVVLVNITGGSIETDGDALTAGLLIDGREAIATVNISDGTVISGGGHLFANYSRGGEINLNLDHADTARAGGIMVSATNSGTTRVTLNGGSGITGDVTNSGSGMLSLTLNNSQLTGISAVNSSGMSNLTLNNSTWTMTGKSRLTTLHGDNGSITIANVAGADLTVSDSISGRTKLNLTLSNGVRGQQEIHVVVDETNAMNSDTFSLGNSVSAGMQTYGLDNRLDGAWLVLSDNFTGGGDAVLNSAAAVSGMWFTQQDNLLKRMGELRYNAPSKGNLIDNLWVRSYGQQTNINTGLSGLKGFSETQYGVDLGTDKAWLMDDNNTLYTGIFAGYGSADRDFHSGYNGSTDSGYGGLYGTWLHQDGWYADALVKGQYFDTSFDGEDHGSYHSYGVGLSLELGRQFQFADGWFAEPSIQVSYLHLINDNYSTTQGMSVDLDDADIVQFYGGARFGRNIQLNGNGWLQPYVKVGALEQISTGGQVKASGNEWRPTTDGARGVIGAGIVYQLSDADQLHLDYEASFGDKYDKPWGLSAGYRHQF